MAVRIVRGAFRLFKPSVHRSYGGAFRRPISHGAARGLASLVGTDNVVHSPWPQVPCPQVSLGEHLMGKLEEHGHLEALVRYRRVYYALSYQLCSIFISLSVSVRYSFT